MAMDLDSDDVEPVASGSQLAPRGSQYALHPHMQTSRDAKRTATLHRIRFLDYLPSSILAIALTPSSYDPVTHYPYVPSKSSRGGREVLAVGRQNGEIELYVWIGGEGPQAQERTRQRTQQAALITGGDRNKQGWVLERRLAPPSPSRVEHLVFTHQTILSEEDYNLCDDEDEVRQELEKLRTAKPRLFSSGGGSDLWEWDWSDSKEGGLGYVKKSLPSQGGAIWSIVPNASHTALALGCDDGAVRLVNLWDDSFEILRKFDNTKTRLLSIAWGPQRISPQSKKGKQKESNEPAGHVQYEDTYIVTGCADSTVRKLDCKTGRCTARMTTDKVKGEHTLVWNVAVIAGSSLSTPSQHSGDVLVSGDSMGVVKLWDEKTNTQIESLKCHKSDVLCLAVGPDGKSVYSSGVDQQVSEVQYAPVAHRSTRVSKGPPGTSNRWIFTHTRRLHAHDVRALAVSPAYTFPNPSSASPTSTIPLPVPIVISGGLDFSLVFTPAANASTSDRLRNPISDSGSLSFAASNHRKASYIPHRSSSPVSFARQAGILAQRTLTGIDLWRVSGVNPASQVLALQSSPTQYKKILEMDLNTQTNLVSSAISDDGCWLAASDAHEVRLWRLKFSKNGDVRAKRCQSLVRSLSGHTSLQSLDHRAASHLHFTSDSSRLVLATSQGSYIVVVQLPEDKHEDATVLRVFSQHRSQLAAGRALAGRRLVNGNNAASSDDESEDERMSVDSTAVEADTNVPNIACLASSGDGQWLASADMRGRIHVYNLDSLQYHAALPSPELPLVSMAFSPSNANILAAALPNNTIQIFDVDQRTIPTWAHTLSRNLFNSFKDLREPILGITFDPTPPKAGANLDTLVIYGANFVGSMKILPAHQVDAPVTEKRKRRAEGPNGVVGARKPETVLEDDSDDSEDDLAQDGLQPQYRAFIEVTHKYQPILYLGFAASGDMVVVEKPYFSMLSQLAPAFASKKYGNT